MGAIKPGALAGGQSNIGYWTVLSKYPGHAGSSCALGGHGLYVGFRRV